MDQFKDATDEFVPLFGAKGSDIEFVMEVFPAEQRTGGCDFEAVGLSRLAARLPSLVSVLSENSDPLSAWITAGL